MIIDAPGRRNRNAGVALRRFRPAATMSAHPGT
jgi:hypothetical protein